LKPAIDCRLQAASYQGQRLKCAFYLVVVIY